MRTGIKAVVFPCISKAIECVRRGNSCGFCCPKFVFDQKKKKNQSRPGLTEVLQWVSQVADVLNVTLTIRCCCYLCVGVALHFLVVRWRECTYLVGAWESMSVTRDRETCGWP